MILVFAGCQVDEALEVEYFGETQTIYVTAEDWCDDNCVVDPETDVMYILCEDGVWRVEGIDYDLESLSPAEILGDIDYGLESTDIVGGVEALEVDYFGETKTIYVASIDWCGDDCVVDPETGVMYIRSEGDGMFYVEGTDRISEEVQATMLNYDNIEDYVMFTATAEGNAYEVDSLPDGYELFEKGADIAVDGWDCLANVYLEESFFDQDSWSMTDNYTFYIKTTCWDKVCTFDGGVEDCSDIEYVHGPFEGPILSLTE